ncbi:aminotransferase class I/II-fold pyridoxal phosphate-dependent enzyme, partial [Burkholderia sp. SIMBA_057]
GVNVSQYRYFDKQSKGVDFESMLADLFSMPEQSIVILHPCCHNPTGADLTPMQWDRVVEFVQMKKLIPFIDMAYQGFGDGIDED